MSIVITINIDSHSRYAMFDCPIAQRECHTAKHAINTFWSKVINKFLPYHTIAMLKKHCWLTVVSHMTIFDIFSLIFALSHINVRYRKIVDFSCG